MKSKIFKTLALSFLVIAATGCNSDEFKKPDYYNLTASTKTGQKIIDGSSEYISHIKKDEEKKVTQGVTLFEMSYLNSNGHAMQMYMYKATIGPVSLMAATPEADVQTAKLTSMAADIENQGKYTVMGAISGGSALGKGDVFFAALNDGTAVCLPASEYEALKSKVTMGYSGTAHLVQGGYVLTQSDNTTAARAAVGVSENGNEVYLVVVDGSDFFYSNGIGCTDLARLMKGCGAHDAIVLTSGNAVTAVWRNIRSEYLFDLLNKPADKGVEAEIAGGIVIVQ